MQINKTCFVSVFCIYLSGLQSFKLSFPPPSLGSCHFPLTRGTQKLPYWVTLGKFKLCCPLKGDFCSDVGQFLQQQPEEPELSNQQPGGLNRKRKNNKKKPPTTTACVLIHSDDFCYLKSLEYKVRRLSPHFPFNIGSISDQSCCHCDFIFHIKTFF